MPKRKLTVPEVRFVQEMPSGEVRIVPESPATINREREAAQVAEER